MSEDWKLDSAAPRVDPTVSWDALKEQGMPLDELMRSEARELDECELCGIDAAHEEDVVRRETLDRLLVYLFSDGRPEAWELVAQRAYAVAKSFFPHLLMMRGPEGEAIPMTLERLGEVFDEQNTDAARSRWQARIDRMVAELIRRNGSNSKAVFQKSPEACAKMSEAARGNNNRNGGKGKSAE